MGNSGVGIWHIGGGLAFFLVPIPAVVQHVISSSEELISLTFSVWRSRDWKEKMPKHWAEGFKLQIFEGKGDVGRDILRCGEDAAKKIHDKSCHGGSVTRFVLWNPHLEVLELLHVPYPKREPDMWFDPQDRLKVQEVLGLEG
jgi:hypothetical protein